MGEATQKELESLVKIANLRLPPKAHVHLVWWDGRTCRLMQGEWEVTPRLSKKKMWHRLNGFIEGLDVLRRAQ